MDAVYAVQIASFPQLRRKITSSRGNVSTIVGFDCELSAACIGIKLLATVLEEQLARSGAFQCVSDRGLDAVVTACKLLIRPDAALQR